MIAVIIVIVRIVVVDLVKQTSIESVNESLDTQNGDKQTARKSLESSMASLFYTSDKEYLIKYRLHFDTKAEEY